MPIRGELRPLYPPNWKELSHRVRFERARGRCEVCGRPHAHLIRCLPDGRWFDPAQQTWRDCRGRRARWPDLLALIPGRTTRIVLAAAHLDHNPTNNRLRNLKSLCQRCHMIHDAPYHRAQRWITHRRRYAAGDLFLGFYRLPDAGDTAAADPPQKEPRLASPIEVMRAWPRDGRQAENPRQWRLPRHPHDNETWTHPSWRLPWNSSRPAFGQRFCGAGFGRRAVSGRWRKSHDGQTEFSV